MVPPQFCEKSYHLKISALNRTSASELAYQLQIVQVVGFVLTFLSFLPYLASVKQLNQAIQYFSEAFNLCQACPPPALFSDICQGLAFCLGRSAPELTTYYLNLSMSVTLRHQAVTRTGKRIK